MRVAETDYELGGYPKFVAQGFNDNFLPVWLQQAGYDTYYTGKLFNAHTVENYHSPHVNGFNGSDFLLDPYTYSYYNSTYQRNHDLPVSHEGQHTVDAITDKALGFLEDALAGERPFFLGVAPIAPHSNVDPSAIGPGKLTMSAPIPLKRHEKLFQDVKIPRTPNFNPDEVWTLSLFGIKYTDCDQHSQAEPAGYTDFHSRMKRKSLIMTFFTDHACKLYREWMS